MESFHVIKESNNSLSIDDLVSDNYTMLTFDIEQDGLPGNRTAYIDEVELQHGSETESGNCTGSYVCMRQNVASFPGLPCFGSQTEEQKRGRPGNEA